ncbi:DUF2267 domain-containing protein [Streptomyces sp. SAI-229]|uniref:DUF2267 domain-containing protein n=1 Tax=Streptomyces sp. SAI-229 TaxID=3377731 RepID=UPI003C7BEDD9
MHHDEFIGKVQALTRLPDRGSSEQATRAVLSTLAERLPPGLTDHVAAQLPPTLAAPMRQAKDSSGERFGLTTFAGRIAGRAHTDEDGAVREAAAVLEVLDAALAPELTEKLVAALPRDIGGLLPVGRAADDTD